MRLVLAATEVISNYTNHFAQTPNDALMKSAEWTAPGQPETLPLEHAARRFCAARPVRKPSTQEDHSITRREQFM